MFFKTDKKPYQYQVEGANFALSNYYTLNRDEPGLGKTIQALLAICTHLDKNKNKRAIVCCPQYLRLNWISEIDEWTHLNPYTYNHKKPSPMWDFDIVVITYDQLKFFSWSWEFTPNKVKKAPWRAPKWASVCSEEFDFFVLDEAHNFKNPKAKRTTNLLNFVDYLRPTYFLQLTGTPIANKLYDLYIPLFLMAYGKHTKKKITDKYRSYFTFCYRFCEVVRTKYGTQFKGKKNVDELKTYLEGRVISRKKKNVLELPKTVEKFVVVDYKENPDLLDAYEKFQAGVEGVDSTTKNESAILVAPFTSEYCLDLFEQDVGPIIVYSDHRESASSIATALKKAGHKVGLVMGGMNEKERNRIISEFKANLLDFIVCTIKAASEGLNLTVSSHIVYNDLPWVPKDLRQSMDRIDRIGQVHEGTYHIMTGPVAGKKIWRSLKEKMRLINAVFEEKP